MRGPGQQFLVCLTSLKGMDMEKWRRTNHTSNGLHICRRAVCKHHGSVANVHGGGPTAPQAARAFKSAAIQCALPSTRRKLAKLFGNVMQDPPCPQWAEKTPPAFSTRFLKIGLTFSIRFLTTFSICFLKPCQHGLKNVWNF